MAREADRVVAYLRQARDDELALARTLRSHIVTAPRGEYRSGLQGYLEETRGHARRVEGRLSELGAAEGLFRRRARAIRDAGGGVLSLGRVPLKAAPGKEDTMLRGAQYGCATEGLVIATYTALEHVAARVGDDDTARLASEIRSEEQRMLEWLRHEILKLTDPFIRGELDAVEPDLVKQALSRAERERADRV